MRSHPFTNKASRVLLRVSEKILLFESGIQCVFGSILVNHFKNLDVVSLESGERALEQFLKILKVLSINISRQVLDLKDSGVCLSRAVLSQKSKSVLEPTSGRMLVHSFIRLTKYSLKALRLKKINAAGESKAD